MLLVFNKFTEAFFCSLHWKKAVSEATQGRSELNLLNHAFTYQMSSPLKKKLNSIDAFEVKILELLELSVMYYYAENITASYRSNLESEHNFWK